jgi:hypothetical protein
MTTERVYIHETIEISVRHRQAYLEHFCSWGPMLREYHGVECLGVWATVGSTAAWPEAVCMWELDGLDAMATMLSGEFAFLAAKEALPEHWDLWWSYAPEGVVATSGFDRLLVATASTPGLHDWVASDAAPFVGYYHETISTPPGTATVYLEECEARWRPIAESFGAVYVGGYRTMSRNDSEAVTLWGLPTWRAWVDLERGARSGDGERWRNDLADRGIDWQGKLLTDAPRSPLRTREAL